MQAEIVSIGTELLMGETVDTNSSYLGGELAKLGITLRQAVKVGDDPEVLFDTIGRAFQHSDVVITTGGLGPTSDDLTREAIAHVFGEAMAIQDNLREHLEALFTARGTVMPSTNLKQATLIPSARSIPNPLGTAPGWWAERDGHVIVAMPGPPRELQRMWRHEVAPRLKERNPGVAIATRTLKTFGITEGGLDEMLSPLFQSVNPSLGIYSKQDGIHLRAIATAATEEEAHRLVEPMEEQIRAVAGEAIWGVDDDTPEGILGALLMERGLTLGVMESFTGGLIASSLAEVEGCHLFLKGAVVAHKADVLACHGLDARAVEQHGLSSAPVAEALASAVRLHFGADIGLGVTGLAIEETPAGGPIGTACIGFAVGEGTLSSSGRYPTHRLRARSRAASHAMLGLVRVLRDLS